MTVVIQIQPLLAIVPNSWITRYLVVLQALFAVFFLGYALHVLWPEQARD
jgi:hypothetical protein